MAQTFLTYNQQINKLSTDKGLSISDLDFARQALKEIGYFSLIGGYKTPFIDPMTRRYLNTTFEDIYALYQFDRGLRELTFRYLCEIEQQLRQMISYVFCQRYGEQQIYYLSPTSYNSIPSNAADVSKLISILNRLANHNTDHAYLVHHRTVYHNVPLWVAMNALTFGQISRLYSLLPFSLQSGVSRQYMHVNERQLGRYLKNLTLFRNVCAHSERLYSYQLQTDFPDTVLHSKLHIPRKGNQYQYGKHDYCGLIIAFRYLLSNESFREYKKGLIHLIRQHCRSSSRLTRAELLAIMGCPTNWESITRYQR